jgi:hypothetical protein
VLYAVFHWLLQSYIELSFVEYIFLYELLSGNGCISQGDEVRHVCMYVGPYVYLFPTEFSEGNGNILSVRH